MALGRSAGMARITIRPDLKNFKRELKREVESYLDGYKLSVDPDTRNAKTAINEVEHDLRKKLGKNAENIPIGFDNKSSREAIKQLRSIEKEVDNAKKAAENWHAATEKTFLGIRGYRKELKKLRSETVLDSRPMQRYYEFAENHVKKIGKLESKNARDQAKAFTSQAKLVDNLDTKRRKAHDATQNGKGAVEAAERNLAKYENDNDVIDEKRFEDLRYALDKARRSYNNLSNAQRQANLEFLSGEKTLRNMARTLDGVMFGSQAATQLRETAKDDVAQVTQAKQGYYRNDRKATAAADVLKRLRASGMERDKEAFRAGKAVIAQQAKIDAAVREQIAAASDLRRAEENATIARMEHGAVMRDYADDAIKVAKANRALASSEEAIQKAKDRAVTADRDGQFHTLQGKDAEAQFARALTTQSDRSLGRNQAAKDIAQLISQQYVDADNGFNANLKKAQTRSQGYFRTADLDKLGATEHNAAKQWAATGRELDAALPKLADSLSNLRRETESAKEAQVNYNSAVREFGDHSEQAIRANSRLADSHDRVARATRTSTEHQAKVKALRLRYDDDEQNVQKIARGGLSRIARSVGEGFNSGLTTAGSKVMFLGRALSSVSTIGMAAGVALAGLGAVNLVPVIGSVAQLGNTLALLPALATAGAVAIAAIGVGSKGIMAAFKAKTPESDAKSQRAAAKEAESIARAQRDATDSLADAQRDAARTAVSNARSIADAEKGVITAKEKSLVAEKAVDRARKDAARNIRDLNDALRGSSLDEEDAVLGLERAKERLREVRRDSKSTGLDRREADLAVRQAMRNIDQVRKSNNDLKEEVATANRAGIQGDEGVVAAKQAVIDANEGIKDAEQGVTDAREAAAQASEDASRRIVKAQEALADALSREVDGVAGGNKNDYADALAELSPNARAFVESVRGMKDAWKDLQESVQDNLFEGLDSTFARLGTTLPIVKTGLEGVASGINQGVRRALAELTTEQSKADLQTTLTNTTKAARGLGDAGGWVAAIYRDLTTVGSQFLPRIADALARGLGNWANTIDRMRQSGDLAAFMERGIEMAKQLGRTIGNIFGGIKGVFSSTSEIGASMLDTFEDATRRFKEFANSAEGKEQLRTFFEGVRDTFNKVWENLVKISHVVTEGVVPAFQSMSTIVGPIIGALLTTIQNLSGPIQVVLTLFLGWRAVTGVIALVSGALIGLRSITQTVALQAMYMRDSYQRAAAGSSSAIGGIGQAAKNASKVGISALGSLASFIGPQGLLIAAIGAAILAFASLQEGKRKLREETERNIQKEREYQATLDEGSGRVTLETRKQFVKDSDESGMLDRANSFGVDENTFVNASLGDERARQSIQASVLPNITSGLIGYSVANPRIAEGLGRANLTYEQIAQAMAGDRKAIAEYEALTNEISDLPSLDTLRKGVDDSGRGHRVESALTLLQGMNGMNTGISNGGMSNQRQSELVNGAFNPSNAARNLGNEFGLGFDQGSGQDSAIYRLPDGQTEVSADLENRLRERGYSYELLDAGFVKITRTSRVDGNGNEIPALGVLEGTLDNTGNPAPSAPIDPNAPVADPNQPVYEGIDGSVPEGQEGIVDSTLTDINNLPGTVSQVPMVDYQPSLNAFSSYGDHLTGLFNEKIKPTLLELIQLQDDFAAKMFTAAGNAAVSWKFFTDNTVLAGAAIDGQINGKILPGMETMKRVQDEMGTGFQTATGKMIESVNTLQVALAGLRESFIANIKNGAVPEWDSLEVYIKDDVKTISESHMPTLDRSLQDIRNAFKLQVSGIATEWSGIKAAIVDPINWVINNVLNIGLKNAWNDVRTVLPSLPEWAATVKPIPMATGGPVSGGIPNKDSVPIMGMAGEFMLSKKAVRAAGMDNLRAFNNAANSGKDVSDEGMFRIPMKDGGEVSPEQYRRLEQAHAFAKEQSGKPYQWAGPRFINDSFDCTGYIGSIAAVLQGLDPWQRYFSTASFTPTTAPMGFEPGLGPGFSIGVFDNPGGAGGGHAAGTLQGVKGLPDVNVESSSGGVNYGGPAIGADNSMFPWQFFLPLGIDGMFKTGGLGGGGNAGSVINQKIRSMFVDPMKDLMGKAPAGNGNFFGALHTNVMDTMYETALKELLTKAPAAYASANGQYMGGAEQWREMAIQALIRNGFDPRQVDFMLKQIQTESSGNPHAIQTVQDINSGGNEAAGLLQIVPDTYAAHRDPELVDDRLDAWSNMNAALRYYKAKYGMDLSTMWGQGHGYDQGGFLEDGTFGMNQSGKPEPVFTADQWVTLKELIKATADLVPVVKQAMEDIARLIEAIKQSNPATTSYEAAPGEIGDAVEDGISKTVPPAIELGVQTAVDGIGDVGVAVSQDASTLGEVGVDPTIYPQGMTSADMEGMSDEEIANLYNQQGYGTDGYNPELYNDYADSGESMTMTPEDYADKFREMGTNFLTANFDQFKSDLGLAGSGALSQAFMPDNRKVIEEHIHYHVTNIEEAMRKEATRQMQNAMTYIGR
ncbi:transglycosylase SLT domain-containing protein [Rhodococcus qingshengii]|uniref:Transglycosylase SLT domain-containing protein n=1 Tax=Rhodococcus qingshengii TaxID=334542 RepID=A0AAW6LMW7_RHOSG|nr:transglycosylase SLT domain-containing protein [Rhodococcus qingshengii]MDE8648074.1 transglycosylase SLT domain-containing protein [Rhodococcus qingshengii]